MIFKLTAISYVPFPCVFVSQYDGRTYDWMFLPRVYVHSSADRVLE